MAFEKLVDLDCDKAISVGGRDKKTGKANPTSIEGYFLGTRQVTSKFSKSGFGPLHIFQTEEGNVGVYGKTNLDPKLKNVEPGTMTRVKFTGTRPTDKGNDMICYSVEIDRGNTIDVSSFSPNNDGAASEASDEGDFDDADADAEDTAEVDEPAPPRPTRPAQAATPPSAAQQAKVQALLNGNKARKTA